jgi:hypothetical protein
MNRWTKRLRDARTLAAEALALILSLIGAYQAIIEKFK